MPDGRLWVASSETYPQVKPGQQPDDKILILEDCRRRRPGRQDDDFRPRPVHSHRHRAGRWRRLCGQQHRADVFERHRRRRPGRLAPRLAVGLWHRRHPPPAAHASAGAPTAGSTATNRSTSTASIETPWGVRRLVGRRHLAVPPRNARAGSLRPRAGTTPGVTLSTAGDNRSPPTAPAARESTMSFPGAAFDHRARGRPDSRRPESRQPQRVRIGNRRWPAYARRLARLALDQRFSCPSRLPLSCRARTARALPRASSPS